MSTRPFAFALGSVVLFGCGRGTDVVGLPGSTSDAGIISDATATADAGAPVDAPSSTPEPASTGGMCTPTGRAVCASSAVLSASDPVVTVTAGVGDPPVAQGGMVVPGSYGLVSETLYGTPEPDVGVPHVGARIAAALAVNGDTYDEAFGSTGLGNGVVRENGNTGCQRLVPHDFSLTALGAYGGGGGPCHDETPYTATASTLTLIITSPYLDRSRGIVVGSYTFVDEFALVAADGGPLAAYAPTGENMPASDGGISHLSGQPRDPRCPADVPAAGKPCDPRPAPLECEYGGDAFGRCTTFAACALQPDGSFAFVVDRDTSCGPNPAACPASFAAAMAGVDGGGAPACVRTSLVCAYPEGVCGCGTDSSTSTWACRARDSVTEYPRGAGTCPSTRPLAGDGCASEGASCGYGSPCSPDLSLGPSLICENGYWEELGAGPPGCPAQHQ